MPGKRNTPDKSGGQGIDPVQAAIQTAKGITNVDEMMSGLTALEQALPPETHSLATMDGILARLDVYLHFKVLAAGTPSEAYVDLLIMQAATAKDNFERSRPHLGRATK